MSDRRRHLQVADLFCGAGNSSNAAAEIVAQMRRDLVLYCVNHWPVAVETHSMNHTTAQHFCQDIETVKPRDAVPGGRLDLLMASPECTHHSRARGGRPVTDQKRATAWCVPRWCADLYVRAFVVENVEEFAEWGPTDSRGRPIPARRGETFRAWVGTLEAMGYRVEWRVKNAADYGDPTTRRRLFVLGRRDRRKIRWPEPSHASAAVGTLFGELPRWRGAREVIDWSRRGRSVFGRAVPLKPNTIRRLAAGVARYFGALAAVYLPALEAELVRSVARWGDTAKGGVPPTRSTGRAAEPFLTILRSNSPPRSTDDPVPAILTSGHLGLVEPWLMPQGSNSPARSVDVPVPALVTNGKPALVEPAFILNRHGDNGAVRAHSVERPIPTVTTRGAGYLVEPFLLGQHAGNAARGIDEPVMTLCAGGAVALVAPYYGSGSGRTCKPVDEPLDTVTAKPRFGLAEAFLLDVNHGGADSRVRDVAAPIGTLTAQRGLGLAQPFIMGAGGRAAQSLPRSVDAPIGALTAKGDRAVAEPFLMQLDQTGGNGARLRTVDEPIPAIVTSQTMALAAPVVEIDGEVMVADLLFRMLEPGELAGAMSFPAGYRFAGNKTEITRQIGNAVPRHLFEALVRAQLEGL